jgi:hypothetical protein
MNKQVIVALMIATGLVGCATQRPQMSDEQYRMFSQGWAVLHHCNQEGWIDADTTARGRAYAAAAMRQYQFDPQRIDSEALTQIRYGDKPAQATCRELAVSVARRKQQIEIHNAQVTQQEQMIQNSFNNTKPTQTYCNKIGNQVMCNSF